MSVKIISPGYVGTLPCVFNYNLVLGDKAVSILRDYTYLLYFPISQV